jgi:hypothetical protein
MYRLTVQHNLHLEQAQAFYDFKKHIKLHCQSLTKVNAIAFDLLHNLSVLNNMPDWHYVFGIHNVGTGAIVMYAYREGGQRNTWLE